MENAPVNIDEKKIYTLFQLTTSIKSTIEKVTQNNFFWIKAEISELKFANSGHAYLNLVEHRGGEKIAVLQATIWQSKIQSLRHTLGSDFDNILKNGSEIVFSAQVAYHQVHGLKLNIADIDLSFNIGALEKRKLEAIHRLKQENAYDKNKKVTEPLIIQKIALIASPNTSAHEDFMKHIIHNEHSYKFSVTLFAVQVQGDNAAGSSIKALSTIDYALFDAVAFIRGGGSKLDLDPYNDYELCRKVADIPITVLTGIGHDTDISVLDMIVKSTHKTPTALADYLVDKIVSYERKIYEMFIAISRRTADIIKIDQLKISGFIQVVQKYPASFCQRKRGDLHTVGSQFSRSITAFITDNRRTLEAVTFQLKSDTDKKIYTTEPNRLNEIAAVIRTEAAGKLKLHMQHLLLLGKSIEFINPEKTMARGFSVARQNGQALTSIKDADKRLELVTTLTDGVITSKILNIKPNE